MQDHCKAIDKVFHSSYFGQSFNIGGENEQSNIELAQIICEMLDKKCPKERSYKEQITFVQDRAGHDRRYAIDSSKMTRLFGFKPSDFYTNLSQTIDFIFINILQFLLRRGGVNKLQYMRKYTE